MSGIFGIFNRDGKPILREIVQAMQEVMCRWDPDDSGTWVNGPAAFGHAMLWNTPESKLEHLPRTQYHLSITLDARIDNRLDLARKLSLINRPLQQITDSELIIAAYEKWGQDCPRHLLGDFSFAIWDKKKGTLFCARDHIGIKQFYYYLDNDLFVFSNDKRVLLANQEISKIICDESIAIYLNVGELWHPSKTFFESVSKLPPANSFLISTQEIKQKTYWKPEECPKFHTNSLDELANDLRKLLDDAIEKRLRSDKPIASHLSGGLDSSTIATIAARLLRNRGSRLRAYNWVQAPSETDDPDYYEWANSYRISLDENIEHKYIDLSVKHIVDILNHHDIAISDTTELWYEFLVRRDAKDSGIQTILSGWGGDELISYSGKTCYSDLFHQGKVISAIKGLFTEAKKNNNTWKNFLARCYYNLFLPLFPVKWQCHFPKIHCNPITYLSCAKPAFARYARNKIKFPALISNRTVRDAQLDFFNQGHIQSRIESWASSAWDERLEYSYPLLDKRIVEFALGIPAEMYRRNGISRYFFRHAIKDLLPDEIRCGDYKYEIKRVILLYSLLQASVLQWARNDQHQISTQYIGKYIDRISLWTAIDSIQIERYDEDNNEAFDRIDTILKSIFTINTDCKYNQYESKK